MGLTNSKLVESNLKELKPSNEVGAIGMAEVDMTNNNEMTVGNIVS